jgi:hypothetical protein
LSKATPGWLREAVWRWKHLRGAQLEQLFSNGRIVDLVVLFMVIECAGIALFHRATGRGLALPELAWNAAAGLGLMMALRNALTGGDWTFTAVWLAAALAGHLGDLRLRWR